MPSSVVTPPQVVSPAPTAKVKLPLPVFDEDPATMEAAPSSFESAVASPAVALKVRKC